MSVAPAVFVGHGSPMNALRDTPFTAALARIGRDFPAPAAVCCISAHWLTRGAFATGMERPRTIHDFSGFPQALFDIDYPAPGAPWLAERLASGIEGVRPDQSWGLDHGAWAVLRKMYPRADVAVVQLSIDATQPAPFHTEMGRRLAALREDGVMILGSGNVVHNLRRADFRDDARPFDWARSFDRRVADQIAARDIRALEEPGDSEEARLAIPTTEHWLPLLYVIGAAAPEDRLRVRHEGIENASISMRTFSFERD